jgi:hypothetical protein
VNDKQQLALLKSAMSDLRATKKGYDRTAPNWDSAFDKLERLAVDLRPPVNRVPALGPCRRGGKSVLLHDCTHYTDGIGWPAFDDVDNAGTEVLAVEDLIIYDNTSGAQGGDAFYCRGASGMLYWYGHISRVPAQGARYKKGAVMTTISSQHPVPHVHLAINSVPLIGHHLISRTDYSHGAPLIGVQLARILNT